MSQITRIHISSVPVRRKPQAGDTKFVKKTGKTMIRQQQKHGNAWVVSSGRPVWEWVEKGGPLDRKAQYQKWLEDRSSTAC